MTSLVRIFPVRSDRELTEFIKMPWHVYAHSVHWVPPLISDVRFQLTDNPFWDHAEKQLFIARDSFGRAVGRIAAIVDNNFLSFQNDRCGFFGYFECEDDLDTARALFAAASEWLTLRGIGRMIGPMNPSTNDEAGFLCDGFDRDPVLMMPYTHQYYLSLAERSGLSTAKELYAYEMDVSPAPLERLERLSAVVRKRMPGLTVRPLDLDRFDEELGRTLEVYNAAWEKNWGFVPWTRDEFFTIAGRMKSLFLPETTLIAENNGLPVGMLIAVPDYNEIMKKINGRLYPTGFITFLRMKSRLKGLRVMIMGVVREYRHKGIEGLMYAQALKNSLARGFTTCEFSWILDDNIMTQRAAEMMGGRLYKRYRIYKNFKTA